VIPVAGDFVDGLDEFVKHAGESPLIRPSATFSPEAGEKGRSGQEWVRVVQQSFTHFKHRVIVVCVGFAANPAVKGIVIIPHVARFHICHREGLHRHQPLM